MTKQEFLSAIETASVDFDVFDFGRADNKQDWNHAITRCPCCGEQADLHRTSNGVLLTCTQCPVEAEWTCENEKTGFGGHGSIHLIRWQIDETHHEQPLDNTTETRLHDAAIKEMTEWRENVYGGDTPLGTILWHEIDAALKRDDEDILRNAYLALTELQRHRQADVELAETISHSNTLGPLDAG